MHRPKMLDVQSYYIKYDRSRTNPCTVYYSELHVVTIIRDATNVICIKYIEAKRYFSTRT